MASRLYGTTRQVFLRVVQVLRALGIPTVLSATATALLALYVTGLILLDRRQTPWRMQAWLPARCHDALNRLLRVMPLSTRVIMRQLANWARRRGLQGYLVLDDVVVEKTFLRHCPWTGWTYAWSLKRKVYGFHVVVLTWCSGPWRVPVAFRLWRPKASCSPRAYRTKLQLAQAMICDVLPLGLSVEYIVFDTNFTAGWFTRFLSRCGLTWVGMLPVNTTIYYRKRRWRADELGRQLKLRWRGHLGLRAKGLTVYSPKYGTIRLVVTRNDHGNQKYIVSNDLHADVTRLVRRKAGRWSIETTFRDTKQFAGLAACQARVDQALVRHVAFALLTFVVLQALRLHPEETLGEVRERLQLEVVHGYEQPPAPLKARASLL